jgi:hypothetical protein
MFTGSGDELCGLLSSLLQAVAYNLPTVGLAAFPAICLLIVHVEISSLPLPPSPMHFQHSRPFCCVLVFSSLFTVQFCFVFFLWGGGQSAQGAMLCETWHSPVWSAKCLPSRFGASSDSGNSPPVFSV